MILPSKSLERKLFSEGYDQVVGVDEVGMGCLAGPVVVCAVSLTAKFYKKDHVGLRLLRDSKLLSPKLRESYFENLQKAGIKYQLSFCYPKTIDRINIYQAARRAMKRAVLRLVNSKHGARSSKQIRNSKISNLKHSDLNIVSNSGCRVSDFQPIVLVDGPYPIAGLGMPQRAIIKGDQRVFAIACASIIAKVHRDRMMVRYAKRFPEYGFEKHKGYGTKLHVANLVNFGPTEIHRRSFAPVGQMI